MIRWLSSMEQLIQRPLMITSVCSFAKVLYGWGRHIMGDPGGRCVLELECAGILCWGMVWRMSR
jgi:hypothetical protein